MATKFVVQTVNEDSVNVGDMTLQDAPSGGVSDGDKGDITVSGSGATWTIDNGVVSTAKLGGDITTAGKNLLDDADVSAQRATLGLGTAALSNTGDFAPAITTVSNVLSGNVAMPSANTFYVGATISLTAGTWLLIGYIACGRAATTSTAYTVRLVNTTDTVYYASAQYTGPSLNPHYITIPTNAIVTIASGTKTVQLQCAANQTNGTILATPTVNNTSLTNTATRLHAIRIA